jgi:hypothetical protein
MTHVSPNRVPLACVHCGVIGPVAAKGDHIGYCSVCAQYRRSHGIDRPAALIARNAAKAQGLRFCTSCERTLALTEFHRSTHYGLQGACKKCQVEHGRRFAQANPESVRAWGRRYTASGKSITKWHRREALKKGAFVADVDRTVIFERDGWKCGLCHKRVDKRIAHPHPKSPSLDHIIPLSDGGTHEPANVQLAHLGCNSAKSNRGGGEQLLLLG